MPYQDKQLKKEFITVDNRTIPFGYPQFWGGDDWEVSGRDNPLPVANYTRNEQDLWVPVSKENPVPTQVTGSNVEFEVATLIDAVTIEPNGIHLEYTDKLGGRPDEIWMFIDADKKWHFRSNPSPFYYGEAGVSSASRGVLYGKNLGEAGSRRVGLWVIEGNYDNIQEAYMLRQPGNSNIRIGIENLSDENMTATVRAYKVWRY